ncbi:carbohydrate ABC transporter permease [Cohnella soli]|uniref:Carbohydrate ABC transporter permease n=1 Tax=Cohnella soli TaxID=425005 RepID=A0ABW0HU19_9BACL
MRGAIVSRQSKLGMSLLTAIMFVAALVFVIPFAILIVTSFKEEKDIFDPFTVPDFTRFDNYRMVFASPSFLSSLLTTVGICAVTLLLAIVFSSMAGYVVSRSTERVFKAMYFVFVFSLIIPAQTNMVMLYKMGTAMHLINTVPYLIVLYLSGNVAYTSLIYAGFTKTIPRQLEEAAAIDGCGKFAIFARIIFPLLMPATATVFVVEVFWYWNDFQGPLIYLNNGKVQTLMLEIYNFKAIIGTSTYRMTSWGPVSAICVVATIPILVFFLFTQKHLLKGLAVGAVKG